MSAPRSRHHHQLHSIHLVHQIEMGSNVLSRRQWCLCLLLIMSTLCSAVSVTAGTSGNSRRRVGGSGAGASSLEDTGDKAVPDQLAMAANRRGSDYSRRGSVIHSRSKEAPSKDYSYGQVELNLVRPEQEPHPKLILSTTTAASGSGASVNLEDSQSAAEYVANAIKLAYKQPPVQIQLKSPNQIQNQNQNLNQNQNPNHNLNHIQSQKDLQASTQRSYQEQRSRDRELLELQLQKQLQQKGLIPASGPSSPSSSGFSGSSSSPPSPALAPAPVYEKEPVTRSYELYEPATEGESKIQGQEDIERHYRPKYNNNFNNYAPYQPPQMYRNLEAEAEEKVRVSASTEIPKSEIMKQIEKSVIKYMKELEAEGKIISTPQEPATPPPPPPPPPSITKASYYKSQPLSSGSHIPSSHSEEKRYSSSTVRPKYTAPPPTKQQQQHHQQQQVYHQQQVHHQQQIQHPQHHQIAGKLRSSSVVANSKPIQHFQSETETAYQAPDLPVDELSPNVEFIYKIKTRAPLQTATVKTVSKPYTLPLKSAEHFDHGAALKNIEEFDLSHVVPTPDRVERERERERERENRERERGSREDQERLTSSGKPHKLYFNSEIYHDINALPYKSKEAALQEYRHKLKASASGELHPDYKGYSGYFAEPEAEVENDSKLILGEDDYPYQYVLKKEPLLDDHDPWLEQQPLRLAHAHAHGHAHAHAHSHGHAHAHSGKHPSLEYDSYSPKFNNNPEGYGYQHTYKVRGQAGGSGGGGGGSGGVAVLGGATGGGKRGKRGGGAHPRQEAIKKQLRATEVKDLEASLALRPPPK